VSGPGRYAAIGTAVLTTPDGRAVPHLRRRFLPQAGALGPIRPHVVAAGERLDLIAAVVLGDAERAWLLADASLASRPSELSRTGRVVAIPVPGGIGVTGLAQ
jgi:hypothetical protein